MLEAVNSGVSVSAAINSLPYLIGEHVLKHVMHSLQMPLTIERPINLIFGKHCLRVTMKYTE